MERRGGVRHRTCGVALATFLALKGRGGRRHKGNVMAMNDARCHKASKKLLVELGRIGPALTSLGGTPMTRSARPTRLEFYYKPFHPAALVLPVL
jgi:hypothetical protein